MFVRMLKLFRLHSFSNLFFLFTSLYIEIYGTGQKLNSYTTFKNTLEKSFANKFPVPVHGACEDINIENFGVFTKCPLHKFVIGVKQITDGIVTLKCCGLHLPNEAEYLTTGKNLIYSPSWHLNETNDYSSNGYVLSGLTCNEDPWYSLDFL
jgi:hypothetical protein